MTDEQLHRVLMDIYREAENKLLALTPDTEEWNYNLGLVDGVIRWLPKCKGIPVKDSLLAYATSEEKHRHTKQTAILSYLRVADAEETRDVLLRFLVGENRMDLGSRSSICRYAQTAFMEADAAKRAAILESLYVALSREENKCNFHVYDDILLSSAVITFIRTSGLPLENSLTLRRCARQMNLLRQTSQKIKRNFKHNEPQAQHKPLRAKRTRFQPAVAGRRTDRP